MDSASPEFPMASSMSPLRPSTPKPQTSYNMLPLPRRFAVIRMDPVAMVEHLKLDAKAMAEARAMCPKKFLIYIDTVDELPMPSSEFCRYSVVPIATELRPADPSRGIEPDMVMPIHPNTNHLGDRLPLETTPPFPFPNCYFWYKSDITVRFRARRELIHWYHNGGAYTLPMSAHGRFWGSCFIDIIHRLDDFHATRSQASNDTSMRNMAFGLSHTMIGGNAPESTLVVTPPLRNIYDLLVPAFDTQNSDIETNLKDYFLSLGNSEMGDIETDDPSDKLPPDNFMNTTIDMDLFGWGADPHIPFIPIVDLWFELEEHLSPDTIDPVLPTCGGSRMKLE